MSRRSILILIFFMIPLAKSVVPRNFFWKPRMGLNFSVPVTAPSVKIHKPTYKNMAQGYVVLIDGYTAATAMMTFVWNIQDTETFRHLSPLSAYWYTNVYRWTLRYLSLIPDWLASTDGKTYADTHKTWQKRFHYMDDFVPEWMRKLLPFIDEKEWKREEWEWKRFKKYAVEQYSKHYRFPGKKFRNFESDKTYDDVYFDSSDVSL